MGLRHTLFYHVVAYDLPGFQTPLADSLNTEFGWRVYPSEDQSVTFALQLVREPGHTVESTYPTRQAQGRLLPKSGRSGYPVLFALVGHYPISSTEPFFGLFPGYAELFEHGLKSYLQCLCHGVGDLGIKGFQLKQ
jgi:hypothetical protein